jgi:hypothetical protein
MGRLQRRTRETSRETHHRREIWLTGIAEFIIGQADGQTRWPSILPADDIG